MFDTGVEFRNVTLAVTSKRLLFRDFSLNLSSRVERSGRIVAILGASGIGKSTLLKSIADLSVRNQLVVSGEVRVGDQHGVVYLPQRPVFVEDRSVEFNLSLLDGMRRSDLHAIRAKRAHFCSLLGLNSVLDRARIIDLSGGERQRVMIARTMGFSPSVLLLDEPATSLDPNIRSQLLWNLRTIVDQERILCVYVTHAASEALTYADDIVFISPQADGVVAGHHSAASTSEFFMRPPTIAAGSFSNAPFWTWIPSDLISPDTKNHQDHSSIGLDGKRVVLSENGDLKGVVSFKTPGALGVRIVAPRSHAINLLVDGSGRDFMNIKVGDTVMLDYRSAALRYDQNGTLILEE